MEAIAGRSDTDIDGFLAAGHAAAITGYGLFEETVGTHDVPTVVGGFEPLDVLEALLELLRFVRDGTAGLANAYPRVVTEDGNEAAKRVMWEVFDRETRAWRGLEEIPGGNLTIASTYDDWNAREQYDIDPDPGPASPLTDQCRCGDIMAGTADPTDCSLFGTVCTPRDLVGPCMVSDEGTCNIWNKYGGHPAV